MAQSSKQSTCPHQTGVMFDGNKYSQSFSSTGMRNGLSETSINVQRYQKPTLWNGYDTRLENDGMLNKQHSFTVDYGTHGSLPQNFGSGSRAGGGWGEPRQNTMLDNNCGQYSFIGSIPYNPAFCKMDTTPSSSRYASKDTNFFYTPQSNVKQRIGGASMEYDGGLKRSLTSSMGSNSGENVPFQNSFKSTFSQYSDALLGPGGLPEMHAKHCTIYNEMLLDKNVSNFRESSLYRSISECKNSYQTPKAMPRDRRQIKSNKAEKVLGNPPAEQKEVDEKYSTKSCENNSPNLDSAPIKVHNNWCNFGETDEESTSDFIESELAPKEEENKLNAVSDNNNGNKALSVTRSLTFCKDSNRSVPFNDSSKRMLNRRSDTFVSNSSRSQYKEISEQSDERQVGNGTPPIAKTGVKWTRITQKLRLGEIKVQSPSDSNKEDKKWAGITQEFSAGETKTETLSDSKKDDQKWTGITQELTAGETKTKTLSDSKKDDQKWTGITQELSAGETKTETLSDSKKDDQKWTGITQELSAGETKTKTLSDSKKDDQKWTGITQELTAGETKTKTLSDSKKDDQKWTGITQELSAGETKTKTLSDSKKDDQKWTGITQELSAGETKNETLSDSKKEVENCKDDIQTDSENITPRGNPERITRNPKQNSPKKKIERSLASLTEEILSAIQEQKSLLNLDHNKKVDNKEKEVCDKSGPKQIHCNKQHDIPVTKSKLLLRYDLENSSSEIRTISDTNQCVPKILGKIPAKQSNRPALVRTAAIFGQYPSGLEKVKDKIIDASGNDQHNSLQTKEKVPSGISETTSSKTCDERMARTILLQNVRHINDYEEKEKENSAQETMEGEQMKVGNDHIHRSNSSTSFSIIQERWSAAKKRNLSRLAWEQWCAMKREKELESKKKEVVQSKTKFEQRQKIEEDKRKKQEENRESFERWLRDKQEKDKVKKRIAARKSAEEKRKEAIERKREERREEFKEAFQTWLKEKEYKLLEQKHQVEEAKRKKEEEEKERKRQCEKAFEEWKMKAVDRPKPMSVKLYDPQIQRQPAPARPSMYINPKPWASDF